jgi:hypothetical protein
VNEVDFCDAAGRLLVRSRTHQSFLADLPSAGGAYVVDRESAAKKEPRAVGEGDGPELEPVELHVDLTTCWRFSGPIKNYHPDRDEAKKLGFPDVVAGNARPASRRGEGTHGLGWLRADVWTKPNALAESAARAREVAGETPRRTRREYEIWVEKDDAKRTIVSVGAASALLP